MGRDPRRRRIRCRTALVVALVAAWTTLAAAPAGAHPLGNFSVNHYDGLTLHPDRIDLLAVVDTAEIPTSQDAPAIDRDDDGSFSADELATAASRRCPEVAAALTTTVAGRTVAWQPGDATMVAPEGAAGLPTLRLTCRFSADVDLSARTTIHFVDAYRSDRVGWHEITASGTGVRLVDPPVPATSISDQLGSYPEDLLASPLDVDEVTLVAEPGSGSAAAEADELTDAGDAFSRFVAAGDRLLQDTIGRDDLTLLVGVLAVLLAMLLGAGHAILPGHGKTVMAAYLAGRRGTRTDAFVVGATVTITHTAGVLVLGLVLTVGSAVAGEVVLRRLGVLSGVLIAGIGASLLRDAVRARRRRRVALATDHDHDHDHAHGHDHHHDHDHAHDPRFSRRGLVGMAMAGGLVPSPSALVVLLGSVALGRTLFGVSLVLAYGVGMAGTLVSVGLVLVRLRGRFDGAPGDGRTARLARRLSGWLPVATAGLVLIVGLGLVTRGVLLGA